LQLSEHVLGMATLKGRPTFAGSSLQLEPGGLCVSGRCDYSTGYRLSKLQGSGCKPEPARIGRSRLPTAIDGIRQRISDRSPTGVGSYQKHWNSWTL